MPLVADFTFFDFFWSMLVFSLWVMWLWLLFTIWIDVFRRDDINGWGKALWLAFTIVLPFLGTFIYVITQNEGMTQRGMARARREHERLDRYVRETAGSGGGVTTEIERAKGLLDSGAITQAEYERLKVHALA